jgi:deazaflavin-dependent oxidoreductase (nitroreductase family)
MKLSRRVARFNRLINNRIQGGYAWLVPPWAVIVHRGRRSGRRYRTPLLAFKHDDHTLIVALLYGEESGWLRNLRAGDGQVIRAGRTFPLTNPRVVNTAEAAELSALWPPARWYCRLAEKQVILQTGERQPGFGPRVKDAGPGP